METLSIVTPVYNSSCILPQVVSECHRVVANLELDYEIVLVDDGSRSGTWIDVQKLVKCDNRTVALRLGRNYGQHSAMLAGDWHAKYDTVVTIDDDLQNPPSQIPIILGTLFADDADVVYGVPLRKGHSRWRRTSGKALRSFLNRAMGIHEASDLSSFRASKTELRDAFSMRPGPGISIDALLAWTTTRFSFVYVEHKQRSQGRSNFSLRKLTRISLDVITGYSTLPLRLASVLGFLTAFFGFMLMIFFVLLPFFSGNTLQGFPFIASFIILFAGIRLISLGVIGKYLSRMHFRIMNKPEYFTIENISSASIQ